MDSVKIENKPKYGVWKNIKFMLYMANKHAKRVILISLALALLSTLNTIMQLILTPYIIGKIEKSVPIYNLALSVGIFSLLLLLVSSLISYLDTNRLYGRITVRLKIMDLISEKYCKSSYENILDTNFMNAMNDSINYCSSNSSATENIWTTLQNLTSYLLGFAAYVLLLSSLTPILIPIIIATTLISYAVEKKVSAWDYSHKAERSRCLRHIYYIYGCASSRSFAKDIRIFGLVPWINELREKSERLYKAFLIKRETNFFLINLCDLVMAFLRNAVSYYLLIRITLKNNLPASEFLLYFSVASGFSAWVIGIMKEFSDLNRQSIQVSTIREFLDWDDPFYKKIGKRISADLSKKYEIEMENVSFKYPGAENFTIKNMNLKISAGEKVAIVGLNGAGKTTLVKLICGMLNPVEGRVLMNGTDINEFDRNDYYKLFSAVFQDFSLIESSVEVNVSQSYKSVDADKVLSCLDAAGIKDFIMNLPEGVQTKVGREVYEDGMDFSGGQIQRLMLARALYKNGPILALDEPTAALDPIAENDIYLKYNDMTDGRTSLFISHRLASTGFCDRIIFLENGKIEECGTHDELMALGAKYKNLFDVQSRYYKEGNENERDA